MSEVETPTKGFRKSDNIPYQAILQQGPIIKNRNYTTASLTIPVEWAEAINGHYDELAKEVVQLAFRYVLSDIDATSYAKLQFCNYFTVTEPCGDDAMIVAVVKQSLFAATIAFGFGSMEEIVKTYKSVGVIALMGCLLPYVNLNQQDAAVGYQRVCMSIVFGQLVKNLYPSHPYQGYLKVMSRFEIDDYLIRCQWESAIKAQTTLTSSLH